MPKPAEAPGMGAMTSRQNLISNLHFRPAALFVIWSAKPFAVPHVSAFKYSQIQSGCSFFFISTLLPFHHSHYSKEMSDAPKFPNLAKSVQLGALKAKNGALMASLTRNRSIRGYSGSGSNFGS